jgi:hypothetical protein
VGFRGRLVFGLANGLDLTALAIAMDLYMDLWGPFGA